MPSFFSSLDTVPSVVDGVSEISFNVESHKLKEQFCSAFGLSLTSTDEEFKSFLLSCDLNESIRVGHNVLRSEEFDFIFGKILSDLSLIFGSIAHQARPTFRIQKKGTRSVPFHTDDLSSGHPNQIINVWIPLVSLDESNTLHFVPKDKSRAIKQQFLDEKSSIDWITEESTRYSQPWISDYGNVVLFSNQTLHGTLYNDSYARASIDFRILPDYLNAQMNKKALHSDYVLYDPQRILRTPTLNSASTLKEATSIIYGHGDASHLSHSLQRAIVNEFASKNSFNIVRETAEWQTPHYPIVNEILDNHPSMPILFASEKCFMNDNRFTPEFKRIEHRLRQHPASAYFCLENRKII